MSIVRRLLPRQWVDKARRFLLFDTDPKNDFLYWPRGTYSDDKEAGFRYPAPASQKPANVPLTAPEDDRTYDTNYFLRDTRRSPRDVFVAKHEDVTMIESDEAKLLSASPTSSKGQQNEDVLRYDPTGLRTTMTASHGADSGPGSGDLASAPPNRPPPPAAALAASLAKYQPDHLPMPSWEAEEDKIIAEAESLGLPVPPGRRHSFKAPSYCYDPSW